MKTKSSLSRRQFIGQTVIAGSAFTFVPSHVLGLRGAVPPSEKLNLGCVGAGGQAASDINSLSSENIVALCDVDWRHAARTFLRFPKAKKYQDYREMLEKQKEIDAVLVAIPDHMHAHASMTAIQMGKHVYCEKPLTHSVWEARQLAQAARKHKVATQMGNQGQASEATRRLCEYVWDGAIGPVREAHIWTDRPSRGLFDEYWPQGVGRPEETPPVPDKLAWDLWIGAAPHRPYHPAYAPFRWRGWWDFGTGALGDIGCHAFDPVFRALKLGAPSTVQASSSRVNNETYPLASMVTYQFPARDDLPPVKLVWYDGGLRPPRPPELEDGEEMGANGKLLIGDNGALLNGRLIPERKRNDYREPPKTIPRSIGHHKEWIEACKGGKPAGSNFDWAGPLTEAVLLGNIALRSQIRQELTRMKLRWDAPSFKFINSDEANQYLQREYRKGWEWPGA